eukprot:12899815-Alexandrium_andersonii.AAC.1
MGQTALSAARDLQEFGAPLFRGGPLRRRASRSASGARICNTGGSEFLLILSHGEGRLACWASWDRDLPWRAGGQNI